MEGALNTIGLFKSAGASFASGINVKKKNSQYISQLIHFSVSKKLIKPNIVVLRKNRYMWMNFYAIVFFIQLYSQINGFQTNNCLTMTCRKSQQEK